MKNPIFIGKTQRGGAYEDSGSKRSPNFSNKAAKMRLWPRFHGLGVAKWPHPGSTAPSFDDFLLSRSVSALDLMKRPLIFGFNQLICRDLF